MRHCRHKGFTLLEALIAVLVLSLGLLGVAAMQLKAVQSAHVAYQRSVATLAAQDAVERLWITLGSTGGVCPDADSINNVPGLDSWDDIWRGKLSGLNNSPVSSPSECYYLIRLAWGDERFGDEEVSSFTYVVQLPGRL